jgi:outer membrane protein TolC
MANCKFHPYSMCNVRSVLVLGILGISLMSANAAELVKKGSHEFTMEEAVKAAKLNDPWLAGNQHSQNAVESMSVAAGTLPDPKVSLGLANLATDTFDFGQEAMTQFKVGVSQMFPRGDSLAIRKTQLELMGTQYPYQRQDRKAKVAVTVSHLWLDAYKAQESIALINNKRALFEQLADVAEASYSSALGRTRMQDIVRAQLELTRLDDRLTKLNQQQDMFKQRLYEWLSDYFVDNYSQNSLIENQVLSSDLLLARRLPDTALINPQLYNGTKETDPQILFDYFTDHPVVMGLDQKIKASRSGIELAQQKYKPEWGVNASYGYRDNDPMGNDRADLFSVGVTFDLPLFTDNRQDKQVESAVSQTESVKTEKWLLLRKLIASFETAKAQLLRLNQRQQLFQQELLPQMYEQAEASLTAYTNDDGDFAEVVRARIAELNAEIDALSIDVDRQKTIIQLNYFFIRSADVAKANDRRSGEMK